MNRKTALLRLLILVLTFAAVMAAVVIYERISREQEEKNADRAPEGENSSVLWVSENTVDLGEQLYGFDHRLESFLFIGTDMSGNEKAVGSDYHGAMADYLLLMVLDYTDDTYGYIQIDRNTIMDVNMLGTDGDSYGYSTEQICTAHWYGKDRVQSAENTVDAVSDLLGSLENISGYYVLSMEDIGILNRSVGGVTVTIDEDLTAVDPAFAEGTTLTLTDAQAEAYLRARMSVGEGTNAERMSRQHAYMESFFEKVTGNSRKKASFYLDHWHALKNAGTTNMNGNAFSRIANMLLNGTNKGILIPEGETRLGTLLQDGLEHEEFYPDADSLTDIMTRLYSLTPLEDWEMSDLDASEDETYWIEDETDWIEDETDWYDDETDWIEEESDWYEDESDWSEFETDTYGNETLTA